MGGRNSPVKDVNLPKFDFVPRLCRHPFDRNLSVFWLPLHAMTSIKLIAITLVLFCATYCAAQVSEEILMDFYDLIPYHSEKCSCSFQTNGSVRIRIAILPGTPAADTSSLLSKFQQGNLVLHHKVSDLSVTQPDATSPSSTSDEEDMPNRAPVLSMSIGTIFFALLSLWAGFRPLPTLAIAVLLLCSGAFGFQASDYQNCQVLDGRDDLQYKMYWNLTATHVHIAVQVVSLSFDILHLP